MNERKKFIEKHTYSIWQGKDGKFYTYLPDEDNKRGKRLVKRTSEKAIEDEIVKFYKAKEDEPTVIQVYSNWISEKCLSRKPFGLATDYSNFQDSGIKCICQGKKVKFVEIIKYFNKFSTN